MIVILKYEFDQDPQTNKGFRRQVWILTGDKEETATSVGFASGLFNDNMRLLHLTKKVTLDDCSTVLQHYMEM